ncbi:hypothetical protein Tco_0412791 [Tanacetum coccineum]
MHVHSFSNPHRPQQQVPPNIEPFNLEEPIENQAPPIVTMADQRTMAQLLQAPTEGYEDAIVVPAITADNFELKHGLLTLAWDRFKDLLRACPHHGFSELHQLDTFYNALNSNDQDLLNSVAGGSGSLPSDTVANPRGDMKAIITRSRVSYDESQVPPPPSSLPMVVEHEPSDKGTTKPTIPYPSRINKEKLREKDNLLALKFMEMFRNLHFELSFADALLHMPKFAPMFRKLLNNKDKIIDLIKTPVNENCSAVILKKFPEKLGDPTFSYNTIESVNRVDVIDVACEEFAQEVLGFSNISKSGNPTPTLEPILSTSLTSLTPFEGGNYIWKKSKLVLLRIKVHQELKMPTLFQKRPSPPLKDCLILTQLPPSLWKNKNLRNLRPLNLLVMNSPSLSSKTYLLMEYAFLEGIDKLSVIIAKDLKDEDKTALLKVLRSRKRAIAWKMSDIKGKIQSFVPIRFDGRKC